MKKVVNAITYDHRKVKGEVNYLPSATVPDLTLSVREIFDRYARGSGLPFKESIWDDDPDAELPNPATLDLVDRADLKVYVDELYVDIDKSIKSSKDDKKTKDVSGEQSSKNDGDGNNE